MKRKALYVTILCILISSCQRSKVTEVRPFDISYPDSTKVLLLKDKYPYMKLVTDKAVHIDVQEKDSAGNRVEFSRESPNMRIRYIPLETTDECLIGGNIAKLESDDLSMFILDIDNGRVLRFLQKDGSFMNSFGQKGRGPGEYMDVTDMSLDRKKKEVCLIDRGGFKFLYYDYDGHFLREEPLYYFYNTAEFVGDYIIQHTSTSDNTMAPSLNNNRLVLARKADLEPEYVCFPFSRKSMDNFHQGQRHYFLTCNENVYYTYLLSDTIWHIKPDGVCEAKFVLKFPGRDNLFDENNFQHITDELYKEKTTGASCYYRDDIRITEDFVHAGIVGGKDLLYSISTGNCKYGALSCNSFGTPIHLYNMLTLNGKSFVMTLQPFEIIRQCNMDIEFYAKHTDSPNYFLNNRLTEEERQLLQKMTLEDNPILMIIDIEPF